MDHKNGNNSNDNSSKRSIDEEEDKETKREQEIKKKKSSRDYRKKETIKTRSALSKRKDFFQNLSVCEDTKKFLIDITTKREFEYVNVDSNDEYNADCHLRDTLLQFISRGLSSQSLSMNEKKRLINPEVITQIRDITFDRLFDVIEDDYIFILLASILKMDVEFFSPEDNLQYKEKEYYHYDDFPKIKRRWMVLEQMQRSPIFCDKRSRNQYMFYCMFRVICNSIKKNLFDRILNYCYYAKKNKSSKLETNITTHDASFAMHYVNDRNFEEVTKAVKNKQITFFSNSPSPLLEEEEFHPYLPLASYPIDDTERAKKDLRCKIVALEYLERVNMYDKCSREDIGKGLRYKLGVYLKRYIRDANMRNFVLTIVTENLLAYLFSIHTETDMVDTKRNIDGNIEDTREICPFTTTTRLEHFHNWRSVFKNNAQRLKYFRDWLSEINYGTVHSHWDNPFSLVMENLEVVDALSNMA